jgi:hypothetical protein
VRIAAAGVRGALARVVSAPDRSCIGASHPLIQLGVPMADVVFVILTLVFFAVVAAVLKGVERL